MGRWLGCNSPCCYSGARFARLSAHQGQYYQPCRLSGGGFSVHIAGWLELRERFLQKVMLVPALASFMVRNTRVPGILFALEVLYYNSVCQ